MIHNNIFSRKQLGFLGGRATTLHLIMVLDKWTKIIKQWGVVDMIYYNFKKAFDKVRHKTFPHEN